MTTAIIPHHKYALWFVSLYKSVGSLALASNVLARVVTPACDKRTQICTCNWNAENFPNIGHRMSIIITVV